MADWSPWYTTGTVSIANAGTTATGVGTNFHTAGLRPGDMITNASMTAWAVITATPTTATSLAITSWGGAALPADSPYRILRVSDADRLIAAHADLMAALVPNLTSLGGLTLAANKGIHANGAGALATHNLTAFMRGVLGSADGSAARLALGANDAANLNAGILPAARLPFVTGSSAIDLSTTGDPVAATYTIRACRYMRLGKLIIANIDLRCTVTNTGTGGVTISGLPFAIDPSLGQISVIRGLNTLFTEGVTLDASGNLVRVLTNSGSVAGAGQLRTNVAGILFATLIYSTLAA